jgi:hypothetical protein
MVLIAAPCNTTVPPHLRLLPFLLKRSWRLAAMLIEVRKSIVSGAICLGNSYLVP